MQWPRQQKSSKAMHVLRHTGCQCSRAA
jgi:hypothetical protein